jgi:hypothetical protein
MRRLALLTFLTFCVVPAASAGGQGAEPPPGQHNIISVRVGSAFVESPCLIAVGHKVLSPGRPRGPGDPPPPVVDYVLPDPNGCRGLRPVVLRRARHLTITLLGQTPQVGASWFAGGRATPLTVRPVGSPPSAIWFLSLPPTSGKLIINLWFPVQTTPLGEVSQDRSDYKIAIRRKAARRPAAPVTPPARPQTFEGTG